ncbi:hypothetical protein HALDL1_09825 [Halobacterium sp. DL1]|jgi:uncharacterized membrane protein (Fun14 family)|nr:hypothetical protein HALDL1_09825 [Halobacterium sp. DL1]
MPDVDLTTLGIEFGGGAGIGAIIGFAAKKIAKLIAVIVGLQLALFKFLESRGILEVDWNRLTAGMVKATEVGAGGAPPSWMNTILSTLSVSAGFTGGFLLGFRRG